MATKKAESWIDAELRRCEQTIEALPLWKKVVMRRAKKAEAQLEKARGRSFTEIAQSVGDPGTSVLAVPGNPEPEMLGERIRRIRNEREVTLHSVARAAKISPAFLSDIEHCRRLPSEPVMKRLAKALKVPAKTLADCVLTREMVREMQLDPELIALIRLLREDDVRRVVLDAVSTMER